MGDDNSSGDEDLVCKSCGTDFDFEEEKEDHDCDQ